MPGSNRLPAKTSVKSGEAQAAGVRSSKAAASRLQAISFGAATGVGWTRE